MRWNTADDSYGIRIVHDQYETHIYYLIMDALYEKIIQPTIFLIV